MMIYKIVMLCISVVYCGLNGSGGYDNSTVGKYTCKFSCI